MAQIYKGEPELTSASRAVSAAIVTLGIVLHRKGVLNLAEYRAEITRLWDEMPAEDAGGADGALLERMVDLLNGFLSREAA